MPKQRTLDDLDSNTRPYERRRGVRGIRLGKRVAGQHFRGVLVGCTECRNVKNIAECDLSGSDLPLPHHCRRMTSDDFLVMIWLRLPRVLRKHMITTMISICCA